MVEPLSVLAAIKVCSSAVKQVKNLVEQGAEIHQCAQHIGKFFAAKQDIEKAEKVILVFSWTMIVTIVSLVGLFTWSL